MFVSHIPNDNVYFHMYILYMYMYTLKKQDILRKKYPYNCFMMTIYQSLLSASVSTFLCTRNLGPEEVSVTAVSVHRN